jgi:hypothetical protein
MRAVILALGAGALLLPSTLFVASACSGVEREPGEGPAPAVVGGVVPEPFRRVDAPRPTDWMHQERGSGVVYPSPRPLYTGGGGSDTVVVLAEPTVQAPVLARLRLEVDSMSWEYVLEARAEVAEGGAVEFGYEELGLPVVEARSGPQRLEWLRVYYGVGGSGEPLTGWVRYDPPRVEFLSWAERLPELPLFFPDPDSVRFHEGVEGSVRLLDLAREEGTARLDYILYPIETRGHWMRVEVVTPSDYCADPESPRHDTTWIRHVAADGRPRVWYHTRGC